MKTMRLTLQQTVGEVMNGLVKRFEQGDIIVEVGRVEAILPRKEQSRAESYAQGDRMRAVIRAVGKGAKVVAAGRGILDVLPPAGAKPTPFTVFFIGNPKGAKLTKPKLRRFRLGALRALRG